MILNFSREQMDQGGQFSLVHIIPTPKVYIFKYSKVLVPVFYFPNGLTLKMMVKSGLEKFILKSLHAGGFFLREVHPFAFIHL